MALISWEGFEAGLIAASTLVLFVGSYYSFVLYQYNKKSKAWLALTAGMLLVALRQMTVMFIVFGAIPRQYFGLNIITILLANLGVLPNSGAVQFFDRGVLTLLVSAFLLSGLWAMKSKFEIKKGKRSRRAHR